jgi:hypothetical protein
MVQQAETIRVNHASTTLDYRNTCGNDKIRSPHTSQPHTPLRAGLSHESKEGRSSALRASSPASVRSEGCSRFSLLPLAGEGGAKRRMRDFLWPWANSPSHGQRMANCAICPSGTITSMSGLGRNRWAWPEAFRRAMYLPFRCFSSTTSFIPRRSR